MKSISCKRLAFPMFPLVFIVAFILSASPHPALAEVNKKPEVKSIKIKPLQELPQKLTSSEEAEVDKMVFPIPPLWTGDFDGMRQRRMIRILVPYSKTFFAINGAKQEGIDYDFGNALEKWINQKYPPKKKTQALHVVFIPVRRDQLLPGLIVGKGDIAAGGLTVTPGRKQSVDFSAPYASGVPEVLVLAPGSPAVHSLEDLSGKEISVRASSSYFEHLKNINAVLREKGKAPIKVLAADEYLESEDLLEMVNAGLINATVVDRYLATIWKPLYTDMKVVDDFYINEGGSLAWAIRQGSPQLNKMLGAFMKNHQVGTLFGNMMVNRHVKNPQKVLNATSTEEMKKFKKLVELFKKHGAKYDFDYLMLIAQGYQESMLNQKARSHVGAVGIMQMLPATAADPSINIKGIDKDAEKNIEAGAKYLRLLADKYIDEKEVTPVNRMLMAFAAYNAGPGNLMKFRRLAKKSGNDPNVWFQNVEYAAARIVGEETVRYVANIYKYYIAYKLTEDKNKYTQKTANN